MSFRSPRAEPDAGRTPAAGRPNRRAHRPTLTLALALALALAGCSTARPWINNPVIPDLSAPPAQPAPLAQTRGEAPASIIGVLTLSGGGARAAAFGLGVLQGLKETRFTIDGRPTTLLDEIDMVSGVSGGSVLAAYYAAFGDEVFTRFENEFLLVDFQSALARATVSPLGIYRLTSPWYGRGHVLAEQLDVLFRGETYGQLMRRPDRPQLLVTATDLTTGSPFEFTREQFSLICSDLREVPLSFAVAASSAVPILLTPLTLRNFAGSCPLTEQIARSTDGARNATARMLRADVDAYTDAAERPYLHLVDGGLTDNLGVRNLLDRTIASGSLAEAFRNLPPRSVHKIVLISVNSERDTAERIDRSDKVPTTAQVLDALVFGAGARATRETTALMAENARRWQDDLDALRAEAGSPFAADARVHVIQVTLRDLRDAMRRQTLLQVPTAFSIVPDFVTQLRAAGREALRNSPDFQALRTSLGLPALATEEP